MLAAAGDARSKARRITRCLHWSTYAAKRLAHCKGTYAPKQRGAQLAWVACTGQSLTGVAGGGVGGGRGEK